MSHLGSPGSSLIRSIDRASTESKECPKVTQVISSGRVIQSMPRLLGPTWPPCSGWGAVWPSHKSCSSPRTWVGQSEVRVTQRAALPQHPLMSRTLGPAGPLQHKPLLSRASRSPDGSELARSEEEVDELSLIDHSEIMARLTLKQEVSIGLVWSGP